MGVIGQGALFDKRCLRSCTDWKNGFLVRSEAEYTEAKFFGPIPLETTPSRKFCH